MMESLVNTVTNQRKKHDYSEIPRLNLNNKNTKLDKMNKFRKADTKRQNNIDELVSSSQHAEFNNRKLHQNRST